MRYKVYTEHDNVSAATESGHAEYEVYDSFGNVVNKLNRYDEIQEAAVGTTLSELIEKYENGEISDFNFRRGQYLDMTQFLSSAIEALNLLKSVEHLDVLNNYLRFLNSDDEKKIRELLFSFK